MEPIVPALEWAERVRTGQISAVELTRLTLERIGARDAELHAFVQLRAAAALRDAKRWDQRRAKGQLPVFAGVPSALKDLQPIRGMFLRAGTRAYRHVWTPADGAVAKCFRRAGFVLTGKTSTSELALLPVVETDLHPPTANPWNPAHTAGGSSGGSAAAVASGMLPVAQASDGAGSIRIPAAFCHLFGFKPGAGGVPHFHARIDRLGFAQVGTVAHTVADAAAGLDILRGTTHAFDDPNSLSQQSKADPRSLRVRVCAHSPNVDVHPAIAAAVESFAATLESLGHHVEPGEPMDGTVDEFLPMFSRMAAAPPILREKTLQPVTQWLRQQGKQVAWPTALSRRDALRERAAAWFGDADLWLTPTVGVLPPRIGGLFHEDPETHFRQAAQLGAFTAVFNLTNQPAASVPAGLVDGLPFGVQLAAKQGQEVLLLRVCRQLEAARPWLERRSR